MIQDVALLASSPALRAGRSYGQMLEDLMWVYRIDFDAAGRLVIDGTIRPDLTADTPEEWRRSALGRYETILALIEEAGGVFARLPELQLTGMVKSRIGAGAKPYWDRMEARIKIELQMNLVPL